MPKEHGSTDIAATLNQIEAHLRNLDRRDRMRMIGSTVRSAISLGILAFALWSAWFVFGNIEELIRFAAREGARQSQEMMKSGSESFMEDLKKMFKE